MNKKIEDYRMTLRLPGKLRESLEIAVDNGSSSSVTAEIVARLEKSFDANPVDAKNPLLRIKAHAIEIENIAARLNDAGNPEYDSPTLSPSIKKLIPILDSLPETQQHIIVESLLSMICTLKSK